MIVTGPVRAEGNLLVFVAVYLLNLVPDGGAAIRNVEGFHFLRGAHIKYQRGAEGLLRRGGAQSD